MPTYRERVYICPAQDGQPGWIMAFPVWWDRSAFFKQYGGRQIDTGNPSYVDYGLLLTSWEAQAWDEKSRVVFAQDPRSELVEVVEVMTVWEARLKMASWVIVESYEWESGLE